MGPVAVVVAVVVARGDVEKANIILLPKFFR
jgi:hypothetical protein